MKTTLETNMKLYTHNPTIEVKLTLNGQPIGVYVGIDTWHSMQRTLDLLRDCPVELLRSLVLHQRFKQTGKPEGISLNEFILAFEKKDH